MDSGGGEVNPTHLSDMVYLNNKSYLEKKDKDLPSAVSVQSACPAQSRLNKRR